MGQLVECGNFSLAAQTCASAFAHHTDTWSKWIFLIISLGAVRAVTPHVPLPTASAKLPKAAYTAILSALVAADVPSCVELLDTWPPALFDASAVKDSITKALAGPPPCPPSTPRYLSLNLALAKCNALCGHVDLAVAILLKLQRAEVFPLLEATRSFSIVSSRVAELVVIDEPRALQFIATIPEAIPPSAVMPQLGSNRALMCNYLHEVFVRDARVAASFHNMQIELYADHNPLLLLPFLRKSSEYSPDIAFKLCKARDFIPEQVFLLGRLGNVSEALLLLLRRMRDVKAAVEFCLEQQDTQLWDTLITSCFDDAALIPSLLDCIGVHPQPLRVVSRIPLGVEIAGLKEKVSLLPPLSRPVTNAPAGCEHCARPPPPVCRRVELHSHHQR